ncbi:iron chelate uptake ABC transporter family permease subunit [Kocuria koreensis]|uniref:Iron chelate uptake ABC transporter family permease subunit n=1 Tax=Rothia koreensis TaxID=592378 RepID=A0A7K1LIY7_9MICC|nr:iron ABC transporter permease [Rothia koreensis]MUN55070.1 iron chelate uptake ABC transporter family permease subunit [Rothia koreensis]
MTRSESGGTDIRRLPLAVTLIAGLVILAGLMVVSVSIGPVRVVLTDVVHILLSPVFGGDDSLSQRDVSVVWQLRVPRILLGVMVGGALAISGACLQSLFNNPLADPGIVGVTSGASVGAVGAIVLAGGFASQWVVPLGAFVAGLAVTGLIYVLARPGRTTGTARMLLVGIAVGSACQALVGFFTYIADDSQLQTLVFWQMGSLGRANWAQLVGVLPIFLIGLVLVLRLSKTLDVLTLGERQAQHLGLNVKLSRLAIIVTTALLTAAAVAFAGSIGFVGLVVPHIMRFLVGPGHKALLPASAIAGAVLVVAADAASRTLNPPTEIPIGLFTAAVGAPFFLFLILREKRRIS